MAQNQSDRRAGVVSHWYFVDAIADISAPTVAEITAGTRFDMSMVGANPTIPRAAAEVEVHGLSDVETASVPGQKTAGLITFSVYRHADATDEAWALFDDTVNPPPTKYLVGARNGFSGAAGAPVAADKCEVYTVQVATREDVGVDSNTAHQSNIALSRQASNVSAVVAA